MDSNGFDPKSLKISKFPFPIGNYWQLRRVLTQAHTGADEYGSCAKANFRATLMSGVEGSPERILLV